MAKGLAVPANMRLEFLPPCSPELNPAEQMWKRIRANHTHNRAWASLADVDASPEGAFAALASDHDTVRSFSLFKWMVYE